MAETRNAPKGLGIKTLPHNVKEAINREQSLRALTINVAFYGVAACVGSSLISDIVVCLFMPL